MGLWVFTWLLNVFERLKLMEEKRCHYWGKGRSHFSYRCSWLPALSFLCPAQTMNREFGGVSCRPAAVSLLESLGYKWRTELDQKWWVTGDWSQLMGEKMAPRWTGLVPQKRTHHFGKEINGVHPAALLAGGQQFALQPPDEAFRCVIVWLFISSVD